MTIIDKVRQRIIKFLKIEHLTGNPNADRYTYLGNPDLVRKQKVQEFRYWLYGDDNELNNYYTAMASYGNAENPLYNINKTRYFWGLSVKECGIKKVHSGLAKASINTLTEVVGTPQISCAGYDDILDRIIKKNKFKEIVNQQEMPLVLGLGDGAFKPIIDKDICDVPLLEFYDSEDVEFVIKHGICVGVIFKDYYKYENREYLLLETRRVDKGDSLIEYQLFRLEKNNEVSEVPIETLPQLQGTKDKCIKGFNKPLAVPCIFFDDIMTEGRGLSILSGKISILDDLDQSLSQRSQTCRVSTPVEYYPEDLLERSSKGRPQVPSIYNRQYIKGGFLYPDGEGQTGGNGQIVTTQPVLNFSQYNEEQKALVDMFFTGWLSPATMGADIAKKDNATAQREKEKVTIMTRNNIIDRQTNIIKDSMSMCLMLEEYMRTGDITLQDYDISVKFDEFANPSFESLAETLLPLYTSGAISTEMYVEKLYGDSLSKDEKELEIARLKEKEQSNNLSIGDFNYDGANENPTTEDSGFEANEENSIERFEK